MSTFVERELGLPDVPRYVRFGFLKGLQRRVVRRDCPEAVNSPKQHRSRRNTLLTIVAGGVFSMLVYGKPPVTRAAQRDFVAGAPVRLDSSDIRAIRIRWEAGARSHWHSHGGWQILATEEGHG